MRRRELMAGKKSSASGYLTFTALESGTFTLTIPSYVNTNYLTSVSYSTNNGATWTKTNNTSSQVTITTPTISAGSTVLWKGVGKSFSVNNSAQSKFTATGNFDISCNIMSLLYEDDYANQTSLIGNYTFSGLFMQCTKLISIENLVMPATALTRDCYHYMFSGCSSLTTVPTNLLPATTLADYCYANMFFNCASLTNVPNLPATTLADYCYASMFYGCTSLTNVPNLPATTLADYCYYSMFYGCTSLSNVPNLPATTLFDNCYYYMFSGCSSLTTVPTNLLPATTADYYARFCYSYMFEDCNKLTNVPNLPLTNVPVGCYQAMFKGCSSLTTVPTNLLANNTNYIKGGAYARMFYGCTSLTNVPNLPATTLDVSCYSSMFYGCTSLTTVPADLLPATTLADNCYEGMFCNCVHLTNVPNLPATTLAKSCYSSMFSHCASLHGNVVPYDLLPATTLAEDCYNDMFSYTDIERAPKLPAVTLTGADGCYDYMFHYCQYLEEIWCNAVFDKGDTTYTADWVYGLDSYGNFYLNSSSDWDSGNSGVPSGWTRNLY